MSDVEEGAGRARLRIKDEGKPTTLQTRVYDFSQLSVFTQQSDGLSMGAVDPISGNGPFARGQVLINANVSPLSTFAGDSLQLEINVLGVVGAGTDIIARFALSGNKNVASLDIDKPYDQILIEGRQVVDGAGSGALVAAALKASMTGRFWT